MYRLEVYSCIVCTQTGEKIYLVLEYCTGGDLAAYIHHLGRVSEFDARHFMRHLGMSALS